MEKMDTLMDICGDLTSLAPTGMKEYLQFNLAVFKASDKAVKIIDRHSEKIEKLLAEIEKQFQENNRSRTIKADASKGFDDSLRKSNESDINDVLDSRFGRK